jgi:hypothetical protein
MIFELTNENVRTAIREYCTSRDLTSKPIESMQFKTSRKGDKGTRVVITTQDDLSTPTQLELPSAELVDEIIPEEVKEDIKEFLSNIPEIEPPEGKIYGLNADKPEPAPTTQSPFKKLF